MASESSPSNGNHPAQRSLLGQILHRILNLLFWMFAALIFSIIVEWIGMHTWWKDEGVMHSQNMLKEEIQYLHEDFQETVFTSHPAVFVKKVADGTYYYMFEKTGIISMMKWLDSPVGPDDSGFTESLKSMYNWASDFIISGITITQLFSVRLAILTLALPAFLMFALVGLADGLVERDLRRWGGGRESSYVYHWAKKPILPVFGLCWLIYLGIPTAVHPNYVILPFAVAFGFLIAIAASKFKKYL